MFNRIEYDTLEEALLYWKSIPFGRVRTFKFGDIIGTNRVEYRTECSGACSQFVCYDLEKKKYFKITQVALNNLAKSLNIGKSGIDKVKTILDAKKKWEEVPLGRVKKVILNQEFPNTILTPLYRTDNDKHGNNQYVCQCKCGNIVKIAYSALSSGNTSTCGCKKEQFDKNILIDKVFEDFKVIKLVERYPVKKFLIQCMKCGFEKKIDARNLKKLHGTLCPICNKGKMSKGEKKIYNLLTENNIPFEREYKFNGCRDKEPLPFDFYVNNEWVVEVDGMQHYQPIDFYGGKENFIKRQKHDQIKNLYCKQNNIPIIRLVYDTDKDFNITLEDIKPTTSKYLV